MTNVCPSASPETFASQYHQCLGLLGAAGLLPPSPPPTWPQLQAALTRQKPLIATKMRQGFTQLLLTPLALSLATLLARAEAVIRQQAAAGQISHASPKPDEAGAPARVNTRDPIWVWARIRAPLDTAETRYFPQAYDLAMPGLAKAEALADPRYCLVPGWSVGLIEPLTHLPRPGQGAVLGGRAQLETGGAPRDYMAQLATPPYGGETGWTPEDFLTHFSTHLLATGSLSHEREQGDATWLLGAWLPKLMPKALLTPLGYWTSAGGRLHLTTHRTANRLKALGGARTIVRLSG